MPLSVIAYYKDSHNEYGVVCYPETQCIRINLVTLS